jgi:transposase
VMSSRLPKVKRVARTLKTHLGGLLTYFKHRITNALTGRLQLQDPSAQGRRPQLPQLRKLPHQNRKRPAGDLIGKGGDR